jgi:hypothetical protein
MMAGMDTTSLLSLPALADTLKLPKKWLKVQADAGRLPHLKIKSRYRFDRDAVEAALRKMARQGREVRHAK